MYSLSTTQYNSLVGVEESQQRAMKNIIRKVQSLAKLFKISPVVLNFLNETKKVEEG